MLDRRAAHDPVEGPGKGAFGHAGPPRQAAHPDRLPEVALDVAEQLADGPQRPRFRPRRLEVAARQQRQQPHQVRDRGEPVPRRLALQLLPQPADFRRRLRERVGREPQPVAEPVGRPHPRLHPEQGLVSRHLGQRRQREPQPAGIEQDVDERHPIRIRVRMSHVAPDQKDVARLDRVAATLRDVPAVPPQDHHQFMEIVAMQIDRPVPLVAQAGEREGAIREKGRGRESFHD